MKLIKKGCACGMVKVVVMFAVSSPNLDFCVILGLESEKILFAELIVKTCN